MASDPDRQIGGQGQQPAAPQAQSLPQATPLVSGQPLPQAQPVRPQTQPLPQAQPVQPQAQPVQPRPQPVVPQSGARPVLVTGGASTMIRHAEDGEQSEELSSVAIRSSPPWLISAVFHMALLIVLGLLMVVIDGGNQISLEAITEDIYAEELGDQTEFDSPLGVEDVDELEEPILALSDLPEVDDPFAAPPELDPYPDGMTSTSDIHANQIGLALDGREEGSKRALLGKYGGTALTEAAVLAGLHWLARNQLDDGSWSLAGPFAGGVVTDAENRVAATAMALLAFQGYGVTHKKGEPVSFRRNVARGWHWLLKQQDSNGNFYHVGDMPILDHHRFYTQGQCTIAACELYAMSKDPKYKEPAEKALRYCLKSQSPEGGWRYSPTVESDVSVTGWVVMALQSAKMAGLEVPDENFRRVELYLDKVGQDGGARYPYRHEEQPRLSMTAEGLLCRQYLGWRRDDERLVRGVEWITQPQNLVDFHRGRNVYYWYYATQVVHHMEGDYWKRWNRVMRQALPEQQVKTGQEKGSWDPNRPSLDPWASHGGRLYMTCLSIYMLEVYYRHLPLYTKIYTRLLKSGRTRRFE